MTDLRKLAETATPGPWQTLGPDSPGQWMVYDDHWCIATASWYDPEYDYATRQKPPDPRAYIDADANAAYIAAASPDVILALLDEVERLRAALKSNASVAHLAWTSPDTVVEAFKMIENTARAVLNTDD